VIGLSIFIVVYSLTYVLYRLNRHRRDCLFNPSVRHCRRVAMQEVSVAGWSTFTDVGLGPRLRGTCWLALLQALSDPYYQSTCLCVCLSVDNFDAKYLGIN